MDGEVILLTGSVGCIGSWVMRHLLNEGADFIATDLSEDRSRPRLLMSDDELAAVRWQRLDVTDTAAVDRVVRDNGVTHIIHLAGLQVPFCKANPPLGAAVNVLGTVNIFEAARQNAIAGLSYASSIAALGPASMYPDVPIRDNVRLVPSTLYGTYKVANEETARIYWQDWQVGSVGLRPNQVFGVGRDQGVTADIAKAELASAAGRPFHIRYDGMIGLQHASDVARMFIASARAGHQGAAICNLRNEVIEVEGFLAALRGVCPDMKVTVETGNVLPFAADLDDSGLRSVIGDVPHTPLSEAIAQDIAMFSKLLKQDLIDLGQLAR